MGDLESARTGASRPEPSSSEPSEPVDPASSGPASSEASLSEASLLEPALLESALLDAERRLQDAQRNGDVAELDRLLDDRLVAIGPDGGRYSKQDDLDAYRSGTSVIDSLTQESLEHLVVGSTGVTFFTGTVSGTFGGAPVTARMRYTRTWAHAGGWRIVAAHIAPA